MKRLLFVDDEQMVLSGLRRALHDMFGSPLIERIIPSPTAIRRTPMYSDRTFLSTKFRAIGCAWRTARPVSTALRTAAASCSNGGIATVLPSS